MHGRAHLLLGAGLGVALSGGVSLAHAPVIATAAVAALLPDLDHEHSDGTRLYHLASGVGALAFGWFSAAHVSIAPILASPAGRRFLDQLVAIYPSAGSTIMALFVTAVAAVLCFTLATVAAALLLHFLRPSRYLEHRGALHWPSLGLGISLVALIVSELAFQQQLLGLAFAVGWFSHLVADLPTFYGMPLLKPFAEATAHTHTRLVVFAGMVDREPYTCHNFHVTPTWLRWHSGHRGVELPIGTGALALSLLATSVDSWLPLVAHAVTRG